MTRTYPNVSGKRNLKDYWDGEDEIGVDRVFNLLVLIDHEIPESVIETWTEPQQRHVANWALRVYFGTEQLKKPEILQLVVVEEVEQ